MTEKEITAVFNSFVGREIRVVEPNELFRGRRFDFFTIDPYDKTFEELRAAVTAHGLEARIWLPDSYGTGNVRMKRVNVNVAKENDGKWHLQNNFRLG